MLGQSPYCGVSGQNHVSLNNFGNMLGALDRVRILMDCFFVEISIGY